MEVFSSLTQVDGDLEFERAYHGYGHSGQVRVGGVARTPVFLSYDHPVWFDLDPAFETITINYSGEADEYFDYDYALPEVYEIFDPVLFEKSGKDLEDEVTAYNFASAVMGRFKRGESPFVEGFVPAKKA